MKLRKLENKDASFMLEWMHDDVVVRFMGANFAKKTMLDCEKFIEDSKNIKDDIHMAIVDDNDEYMGNVSLKHINRDIKMAEFAITIRKVAMGKGYSSYGMKEMIRIGFEELKLEKIIWCVSKLNKRAVRFYEKNGYERIEDIPEVFLKMYSKEQSELLVWYFVSK